MKYIGAHVSAGGGVENGPLNAHKIGATAFALFTKNQKQWSAAPLTEKNIELFKQRCEEFGYTPAQILPHDSYLINLGHPEAEGDARRCRCCGRDRRGEDRVPQDPGEVGLPERPGARATVG